MNPSSHGEYPSEWPPPVGLTPLYGAVLAQDMRHVYDQLRRYWGPIAPVELTPGVGTWLVLGHQEVLELVWDERAFSSDSRHWNAINEGLISADSPLLPILGWRPALSRTDEQEHRQQRQAVTETLDRIDLRRLRIVVRQQADALVDGWAVHGTADLVTQYGHSLVWSVFTQLLGLSDDFAPRLDSLITRIVDSAEEAADADAELMEVLHRLVAEKRAAPGPDLPSWLLAHAAQLTDAEVAHNLAALLLAGTESSSSWISNTVRLLLSDSGLISALANGRLTVSDAVDRALWAGSPVPNITGRWARADVTFAGCRIRAGDLLIPCLAAANTDPGVQGAGDSAFGNRAHLAWGTGAHGCPAKDPARLIVETAVDVLLHRLPEIRPAVPDAGLQWRPSLWRGAPAGLPVAFPAFRPDEDAAAPPEALTVMPVPEGRRDDSAPTGELAPQRWGWWDSMGGW
ncbi:cytochrome P450 [Streptomyces sp. A3M-1-3]|uniref:cytochrome P450 n=1 Tax=Streptomyces sp. A3M-1-3 TaxID=2962044 RepID=UPI0020B697E3|nr:cytochrome P450 [Streptomyces sp. A3M-1-3]MCP3818488.1 cytochrome P450 [Streptomyces sp. A3M-1-3]